MKLVVRILPFFVIVLIVFLGFQQRWHYTLSGDFKSVYFPISRYFSIHHDLTNFPEIMIYPPGANFFFLLLPSVSVETFEIALISANILFLILMSKVVDNWKVLFLVILCAGPIILFRFDLLVMLFVALSIVTFKSNRLLLSGLFLGLATITKFFPIILLPYFLLLILSAKKYKEACLYMASFLFAVNFVFFLYAFLTNQNWLTVIQGMNVAFSVSVHVESVLGSVLTIITGFTNPGPHGVEFRDALWVLSPLYFLGHARVFKLVSPLFLAVIYLLIFLKQHRSGFLRISTCLLIVLTLLISSQLFSPQYVLWPGILLAMLAPKELATTFWKINIFLLLVVLVCTQIIYPLNYGELLDFFNLGKNLWLFAVLVIRNLTLVILGARLLEYEISLSFLPKK